MSRDRREEILARLVAIAGGIPGIAAGRVFRNQEDVTARAQPAIVIFDGDETTEAQAKGVSGRMVEMTPEVRVLVDAKAADVGSSLNGFRAALIKAVVEDAELQDAVGSSGVVRYDGCTTDTAKGERIEGGLGLNFVFKYPLIPSEL